MKLLNLLDIQRYVRSCAAKANLNVVYEDTKVPYCTEGVVHLPNLDKFTTDEQLAEYLYFIEHETAHAAHSKLECFNKYEAKSFTGRAANLVEDFRIDNRDARWYDGFKINRDQVVPRENDELVKQYEKFVGKAKPEQIEQADKYMAMQAFATKHDESGVVAAGWEELVANDNIRQWVDKLDALAPALRAVVDGESEDAIALAEQLVKVFDHDSSQDSKEQQQESEGNQSGSSSGEGEGEQQEGEGESQPSDGKGESKEGKGEKGKSGDEDGQGFGNHFDHKSGGKQGRAIKHDYKPKETRAIKIEYGAGMWVPCLPSQYNVVRLAEGATRMLEVIERAGYAGFSSDNLGDIERDAKELVAAVNKLDTGTVDGFAQQVRRLLQIRARSRHEYGVKRGKLDQARLSRIAMRDAPGFNERVFKRKIVADTTDTAVMLLLDASGSMEGSKWAHAVKSAELINATVSRALGIPLEVLAFTDDTIGSVMYEGKLFNELRVGDDELVKRLGYATSYMSGNADGEAIMFAYDRLRQRKEKRKVLIVCSDGAPSASGRGSVSGGGRIDEYTKAVIQEIEADPHVDIYGLGIYSTSVELFYTKYVVLRGSDSLEQALLTLIDKSIA